MSFSFRVAYKFPGLNEYTNMNRIHWTKGREMKRAAEEAVMWAVKEARAHGRIRDVEPPYWILFEWHEASHKRDPDNIASAKKYVLDAMQKAGVIRGDSQRYICGLHDVFVSDSMDGLIVTVYDQRAGTRVEREIMRVLTEECDD